MKESQKKQIEALAAKTVAKVRAARLAAQEPIEVRRGDPTATGPILESAVAEATAKHADALASAQELSRTLSETKVQSLVPSAVRVAAAVQAAQGAIDTLKNAPDTAAIDAATEQLEKAEAKAVSLVGDTAAALETAPEAEVTPSVLSKVATGLNLKAVLPIIAGIAIVAFGLYGLWALFSAPYKAGPLFDKLAHIDYARGLITFILALGTMLIALMLVVGALLGGEDSKDNFTRGKEVLTVLIGVLGTILGFYFGSEREGESAAPQVSAVAVSQAADGKLATIAAEVSGGKPPYTYSIRFEPPGVIADVKDEVSENGRISADVDIQKVQAETPVMFTVEVVDHANKHASYQSTSEEAIARKVDQTLGDDKADAVQPSP